MPRFKLQKDYDTPKIKWYKVFIILPRWLEDTKEFAYLSFVWRRELEFGPSWFWSDRSWEHFSFKGGE